MNFCRKNSPVFHRLNCLSVNWYTNQYDASLYLKSLLGHRLLGSSACVLGTASSSTPWSNVRSLFCIQNWRCYLPTDKVRISAPRRPCLGGTPKQCPSLANFQTSTEGLAPNHHALTTNPWLRTSSIRLDRRKRCVSCSMAFVRALFYRCMRVGAGHSGLLSPFSHFSNSKKINHNLLPAKRLRPIHLTWLHSNHRKIRCSGMFVIV